MTDWPPKGFWSYARHDGDASDGRMDALHYLVCQELGQSLGLAGPADIFLDKSAISTGDEWERMITRRLAEADFVIAMLSPNFLSRPWCCKEVMLFREREKILGSSDMIFPVEYFSIKDIVGPLKDQIADPAALVLLEQRQIKRFAHLRRHDPKTSDAVGEFAEHLATEIKNKLIALRTRSAGSARPAGPVASAPPAGAPPPQPAKPAVIIRPLTPAPGTVIREEPGPEMVLIPAGTFMMGIPDAETQREGTANFDGDARPVHKVTVSHPFWLGKYPVTRGEYATFAQATRRAWEPPRFPQDDRHPAVNVSFDDAQAYLKWLSDKTGQTYRLPSEAEWEYACRAGTQTARYWGDAAGNPGDHAHFDSRDGTCAVGRFAANKFGLHDMLGNVWERTADGWHDSYEGAPPDGSAWLSDGSAGRVVRGGSWRNDARFVRSACRGQFAPVDRDDSVGFRCARVQVP